MKIKTDQYTIKWIKLILFFIIALILSYFLAFTNTINLYKRSRDNKTLLLEINEKPKTIKQLEQKIVDNEEQLIKVRGLDSLTSTQKMLDLFAGASSKFTFSVKEVSPSYISANDSLNQELSVFTLEGNFSELLKTWNYIEKQLHFGNISSSRFYISQNYKLNLNKLNLILYVELFKNKKK